jgi:hypothetical protein
MPRDIVTIRRRGGYFAVPAPSVGASTFDPAKKGTDVTLSGLNLIADNTTFHSTWATVLGTTSKSAGKYYVEFLQGTIVNAVTSDDILFGFTMDNMGGYNQPITGGGDGGYTRFSNGGSGPGGSDVVTANGANLPTYTMTSGDVLALALDFGAGKGWVAYNNTFGGNPAGGTNPAFTWTPGGSWFFAWTRQSANPDLAPVTIRPGAATQSFSPPAGFSRWD